MIRKVFGIRFIFKNLLVNTFLLIFLAIQANESSEEAEQGNNFLHAVLIADLDVKQVLQANESPAKVKKSLLLISYETLNNIIDSLDFSSICSREELVKQYMKHIYGKQHYINTYEQMTGQIFGSKPVVLDTYFTKKSIVTLPQSSTFTKKKLKKLLNNSTALEEEDKWVHPTLAFYFRGMDLTSYQIYCIEQYIEARDQGKPHSAIKHLLTEAGINPDWHKWFHNPDQVRLHDQQVLIKIDNSKLRKRTHFGKYAIIAMPLDHNGKSVKVPVTFSYKDRFASESIKMYLKSFIIYKPIKKQYITYCQCISTSTPTYYCCMADKKGWKCIEITRLTFKTTAQNAAYLFYERASRKKIIKDTTTYEEKLAKARWRNRVAITSFTLNTLLAIGCAWFSRESPPPREQPDAPPTIPRQTPINLPIIPNLEPRTKVIAFSKPPDSSLNIPIQMPKNLPTIPDLEVLGLSRNPADLTCFYNTAIQAAGGFLWENIRWMDLPENKLDINSSDYQRKPMYEKISRNIADGILKKKLLNNIEFSRGHLGSDENKRTSTDEVYRTFNLIFLLEHITSPLNKLKEFVEKILLGRLVSNENLIKDFYETDEKVNNQLANLYEFTLSQQKPMTRKQLCKKLLGNDKDFKDVEKITEKVVQGMVDDINGLIKSIREGWNPNENQELFNKYFIGQGNIKAQVQEISKEPRYTKYKQEDTGELVNYLGNYFNIPKYVYYKDASIVYDATRQYDITLNDGQILTLQAGFPRKALKKNPNKESGYWYVYMPSLPADLNTKKDKKLSFYLDKELKKVVPSDDLFHLNLFDFIDAIAESKQVKQQLFNLYDEIDQKALNTFEEYQNLKNQRQEYEKYNNHTVPNKDEENAFQKLLKGKIMNTLVKMGFDKEKIKNAIRASGEPGKSGIRLNHDRGDSNIQIGLQHKRITQRKLEGDYLLIAPKLMAFDKTTFQNRKLTEYKIKPSLQLTLQQDSTDKNSKRLTYQCIGLGLHDGPNLDFGHYTAYRLHEDKWYYVNDSMITPLESEKDLEYHLENKLKQNNLNLYLFVYKKIKEE